jgi:serine/threonine protein kinase
MSDLIGKTLGQYTIVEQVGMGGMAAVYRAEQKSIGRDVAIKVMLPHVQVIDESLLDRFHREVKIAASLQHPHILPIYDFGDYEGRPYIVMAYFTGGSLADQIKASGAIKLTETARLVRHLADALDYAHSRGVIHRDLKPDNTIFDDRGNLYLTDFGVAKVTSSSQLTGTGTILGTPDYMAPDWGQAGDITYAVDIYALGVTVYEMLSGHVPFKSDTPMAVLMAHLNQPVPDILDERPDLPEEVGAIIATAMAKRPLERFSTAGQMAVALDSTIHQFGEPIRNTKVATGDGPFFYPNHWGTSMLESAEPVFGKDEVDSLLFQAGLAHLIDNYPPTNNQKQFPFESIGRLWQYVYQIYGRRGLQSLGRAAGQRSFQAGLEIAPAFAKVALALLRAAPAGIRLRISMENFARMFNGMSDQVVEVEDAGTHLIWRITRCPLCWGWQADEPVCYSAVGVLEAAFAWGLGGQRYRVTETECIAKGDPACVLRIDKTPLAE